jgi:cyclopropane-fatty-acyl-phospholipid synthase
MWLVAMNWLLKRFCTRLIRTGTLRVTDPAGTVHEFGDGTGAPVHLHVKTPAAERAILLNPELGLPEMFMAEKVDFLEGDVISLVHLAYTNMDRVGGGSGLMLRMADAARYLIRRFQQINTAARARANVRHHYDLSGDLYRLFLDEDMQYSCAYFETPDMTLEEAQAAKKRHLAAKMRLKPGQTVLDIGSGWGGLGLYLAKTFEVDVLAESQEDLLCWLVSELVGVVDHLLQALHRVVELFLRSVRDAEHDVPSSLVVPVEDEVAPHEPRRPITERL